MPRVEVHAVMWLESILASAMEESFARRHSTFEGATTCSSGCLRSSKVRITSDRYDQGTVVFVGSSVLHYLANRVNVAHMVGNTLDRKVDPPKPNVGHELAKFCIFKHTGHIS